MSRFNNSNEYENTVDIDANEEAKDVYEVPRREILKNTSSKQSFHKSQSMNSVTFSDIEFGDVELVDTDYTDPSASDSSDNSIEYGYDFNYQVKQPLCQKIFDRFCVILAQSLQIMYLIWRWHRFCTTDSTWALSSIFIVMETLIVFFGSLITYFIVWNQSVRPKLRLEYMKLNMEKLPTIDIMIPCYNEPVDIVRKTIIAALNLDYPAHLITVCVCDDGNSPDMRSLITQIRADLGKSEANLKYVARKKTPGVPHHAKAGNVNNALFNEGLNGEFIVIFDCDMVCKPWMLQAILPHFYLKDPVSETFEIDEQIAMIQTPQSFINIPLNDLLGQQYRYFYGPVLRGWDSSSSTPCCGTNVVFSRKALTSIGGFTYGSITEDFLTSMTLHNAKYKTKYVHEYLASGLAPDTLHDFYKQRMRWAAGGLQIFKTNNAIGKSGLNFVQKYLYFWSGMSTCLSVAMIWLIICPIIYIYGRGHINLATFDTYEYLYMFGPYMFMQVVCMKISYRGLPHMYLTRSFQESVFMLFCYARCVFTVLGGIEIGFRVTSKDGSSAFKKSFNWVIPFLIYYALAAVAVALALLDISMVIYNEEDGLLIENGVDPKPILANCVSIFWISLICWQMTCPLRFLYDSVYPKKDIVYQKMDTEAENSMIFSRSTLLLHEHTRERKDNLNTE